MSIKGYPTQEKDDRLSAQFATVEPVRELQNAMSVVSHQFVYQVGIDTVEAGSTTSVIVATAHSAVKGDVIHFTSGALSGREVKVYEVSVNSITLAETLSVAPAAADAFEILRHKYPAVDSSGAVVTLATEVATAANGGALPALVKVVAGYDGSAVQVLSVDGAGQANVNVISSALPLDAATESTLSTVQSDVSSVLASVQSLDANLTNGTQKSQIVDGSGNVIGSTGNALDVNVKTPITVDVSLSQANDSVAVFGSDGSVNRALKTDINGELQVDVLSSALPSGAATEAKQDTGNTSLSTLAGTVSAGKIQVDVVTSALPLGAATSANQTNGTQKTQLVDGLGTVITSTAVGPIKGLDVNVIKAAIDPGNDVFATALVGTRYNQIEVNFETAPGATFITQTFSGGGAVSHTNGHALYSTSTGATAQAKAVTVGNVVYRPGAEIYADFTASFTTPTSAASYQRIGIYNASNGFFIGYEGTSFGVTIRTGGVDTSVPRASFNGDLLTGAAGSKFTRNGTPEAINLTYSNLFRIRYGWLGSASILFDVFSPDGIWVNFHTIKQPNSALNPSIQNPNLPITLDVSKTASDATNLIMSTACWAGGTSSSYTKITDSLTDNSLAGLTRSVITGVTTGGGGGYVNVKVNPSGALVADVTGTVAATQSGTWNINNVSGTISLPTGAATETTLSAINTKTPALGQAAMVASTPVVIASNQTTLPVSQVGRSVVGRARNVYSSTNVTTGAYVQLVASLAAAVNEVEIFDSSGETLVIATGGAGSEVDQVYVFPGGNGRIPLAIASGARVSIKAVSANATAGEIAINFYS
jgi:hypothetical protein